MVFFNCSQIRQVELNSTHALVSELRRNNKALTNEMEILKQKYEATKKVCKAKSRRLKDIELKLPESAINQL